MPIPTLASIVCCLMVMVIGGFVSHGNGRVFNAVAAVVFVAFPVLALWHLWEVRCWRSWRTGWRVIWCCWTLALVGLIWAILHPNF